MGQLPLLLDVIKAFGLRMPDRTAFEEAHALFAIEGPQVRISKLVPGLGEEALTILSPGDFFGEVEFFDGSPSSAAAIAHSDCETLSIPHQEITTLMRERPALSAKFLWAFARTLAGRLRDTNEKMTALLAISRAF